MVQELFSEPTGLEQFVREQNARESARDAESPHLVAGTSSSTSVETAVVNATQPAKRNDAQGESTSSAPQISSQMEQALGELEECEDLQAAKLARAEASAELAEFDESVPWEQNAPDAEGAEAAESPADGSVAGRASEPEPPSAPVTESTAPPASKTEQEFAIILSKVSKFFLVHASRLLHLCVHFFFDSFFSLA